MPPPVAGAVVEPVVSVPVVSVPVEVVGVVEVVPVVPPARASAPAGTVRSGVDFGCGSATLLSEPQPPRPRATVASRTATGTTVMRTRIGGA